MIRLWAMRAYELVLVTRPSLAETLRKKLVTSIKALLKDFKVAKENEIGLKTLAYKIKKESNGFYLDLLIEGDKIPQGFEKKLLENDNILRHLLLRTK